MAKANEDFKAGEYLISIYIYRQKYHNVESEASKTSEVLKDSLGSIKDKVRETLDEVGKTELAKKAGK